MPPIEKKTEVTDQNNKEAAPQNNEIQKALAALQEQNKILQQQLAESKAEKEEQKKKAEQEKQAKTTKELEDNSDLAKLLEQMKEVDDDEKPSKKTSVDNLSNAELLDVMTGAVEKFFDARIQLDKQEREKTQDGFLRKLGTIESTLGGMLAVQSVNELRSRYSDFNEYSKEIGELLKETPGLSVEKAYKLAKAERLEKEPPANTVETEIPNIGPNGLPSIPERKERVANRQENTNTGGVVAFRSFLTEGIGRAMANRHKQS